MRRPWHAKMKAAFGGGDTLDLDAMTAGKREELRQIAEAIIFIREDGPKLREQAVSEVESCSGLLDELVDDRRKDNPDAVRKVTDMVRIAVLNEWKTKKSDYEGDGGWSEGRLQPRRPRRAGEDRDDAAVVGGRSRPLRPRDRGDPACADDARRHHPVGLGRQVVGRHAGALPRGTPQAAQHRRRRRGLQVHAPQFDAERHAPSQGDGRRHPSGADRHPLRPAGGRQARPEVGPEDLPRHREAPRRADRPRGLKAKLSGSHVGQLEVERGSDGIKLHLRSGFAGTLASTPSSARSSTRTIRYCQPASMGVWNSWAGLKSAAAS